MNRPLLISMLALFVLSTTACSDDPTSGGGEGGIAFTTWGEEYIQAEIPADSADVAGFVDGWTLTYSKFLVVIENIAVADSKGNQGARFASSKVFDHTGEGVKSITTFDDLEAKDWDRVSYEIGPAGSETEKDDSVSDDDLAWMTEKGNSLHLVADVTKDKVTKHLDWAFDLATSYTECHATQDGKEEDGVVVTNGKTAEVQLTIHGDHPFYDRLQASEDPAIKTSLRFDAIAAADEDDDGEVTLEELDAATLDVLNYDRTGFAVTTQGGFVRALARTVGHFRGEGECNIKAL
jgi:hypothetical protein